jgi:sugar transferase (PEP-CTERM/EpsH1 system associated)
VRILLLTHRLPYAPNRGDRVRAHHLVRALAARGAEVDVISLAHDAEEEARAPDLARIAARVAVARVSRRRNLARGLLALATGRPLTHALLHAPGMRRTIARAAAERPPDVVLAYCSGVAPLALAPPLAARPLVLDMVDVDSAKWAALARAARPPMRWIYAREARRLARIEAVAARRAYATLVVNERERAALARIEPEADVRVIENGVDAAFFRPPGPPSEEPRVVFTGVLDYAPNVDAVLWLAREVWPQVLYRRPDARLALVGASPTKAVRALASEPSIEVTGTVADVRPHLFRAAVGVAPLALARGVQNKALEAIAAGLPVVVTPVVYEGLPAEAQAACAIAVAPEGFAGAIVALLAKRGEERRAMAGAARLEALGWADRLAPVAEILEAAVRGAPKPVPRGVAAR